MYRIAMMGHRKMGMPIARNLRERGFGITGCRRSGSPELADIACVHDQIADVSALRQGEPS